MSAVWPVDGDKRRTRAPNGGWMSETYMRGRWWRYSDGRTPGAEPGALSGTPIQGPPEAYMRAHRRRMAGRSKGRGGR